MIKLKIKPIDMVEIRNISNAKPDEYSAKTILKAKIIKLRYEGKSNDEIIKETKVSERTISTYIHNYLNQSFNHFFNGEVKYRKSSLSNNADIKIYFKENCPASYRDAVKILEEQFDIHMSLSAVRVFLRSIDVYTERSRTIPSKFK